MCAIIGVYVKGKPDGITSKLMEVFRQSSIRGLHATGITYLKGGELHTIKEPVPASEFDFDFDNYWNEDGNLYLIGHCRYSTSDLEYNQPLNNEIASIVHNGVISQEHPSKWPELFSGEFKTKNDSEILLNSFTRESDPLKDFPDSSIAACFLTKYKQMAAFRNGKRPCYVSRTDDYCIATSTLDIAKRSGLENTERLIPYKYFYLNEEVGYNYDSDVKNIEDLQP